MLLDGMSSGLRWRRCVLSGPSSVLLDGKRGLLSGRDRSAFPNFQTNLGTSEGEFGVFAAFVAASGLATDQPSAARACPTRAWRCGYLSSDWGS